MKASGIVSPKTDNPGGFIVTECRDDKYSDSASHDSDCERKIFHDRIEYFS